MSAILVGAGLRRISSVPVAISRLLAVKLGGAVSGYDERIFDKLGEGNIFPDLARISEMKQVIAAKIWPVWKMLEKRNSRLE